MSTLLTIHAKKQQGIDIVLEYEPKSRLLNINCLSVLVTCWAAGVHVFLARDIGFIGLQHWRAAIIGVQHWRAMLAPITGSSIGVHPS